MCTQTLFRDLVREKGGGWILAFILLPMGKYNRNIENCEIIVFSFLHPPSPSFQNSPKEENSFVFYFSLCAIEVTDKDKRKEKGLAIFESCRCVCHSIAPFSPSLYTGVDLILESSTNYTRSYKK